MTSAERAFWEAVRRKMASAQPDVARAWLAAFRALRESISEAELVRLITAQGAEGVVNAVVSDTAIRQAFTPFRVAVGQTVGVGFDAAPPGVAFGVLDPTVVDAVRQLSTRMVATMAEDTREVVRALVENGLRDGVGPRTLARDLRATLGLAPNQEQAVRNYRKALEGTGDPLDYKLRSRRFDQMVREGRMTPERVDRAVDAYRKRMLAFNAETNARTATTDSFKLGQQLAWDDAVAKGIVMGPVVKTWIGVMDDRERPEHVAMQGETVPKDSVYSNGEDIPGESTFNCRCVSRFTIQRAA